MADGIGKFNAFKLNNENIVEKQKNSSENNNKVSDDAVQNAFKELFSDTTLNEAIVVSLAEFSELASVYTANEDDKTVQSEKTQSTTKPNNSEPPIIYEGSFNTYRVSEKEYDWTNLPMEYEYDGEVFHCVGFSDYVVEDAEGNKVVWQPQSWKEVQEYFNNAGVTNEGIYGTMQCQNFSDMMGQFVLGEANTDFVQSLYDETNDSNFPENRNDEAALLAGNSDYNPRNYAPCKSANRDEQRAIIENELQNGRPALVYVNDHHWVAAIGLSDDGDILIWDSFNGYIKKLYQTTSSKYADGKRNPSERNMSHGDGSVMVYVENYHYENGKTQKIDYINDYVNGSSEKARKAGTLE